MRKRNLFARRHFGVDWANGPIKSFLDLFISTRKRCHPWMTSSPLSLVCVLVVVVVVDVVVVVLVLVVVVVAVVAV